MGKQIIIRRKSGLSPMGMLLGGLVGALVGALVRGGITFYNLRAGAEFGLLASLPSAGIGFLCGAIAGLFCRGWVGSIVGAILSAGVFGLVVLPCAYLFSVVNAADKVGELTWLYFVQKAIAGAIAGGVGGFVGRLIVASENQRQTNLEAFDDAERVPDSNWQSDTGEHYEA